MTTARDLVIIGDGEFATIAYEYFSHDSAYRVVGFAVERAFLKRDRAHGLPVTAFEDIHEHHPPESCDAFVAVTSTKLNRVRARLYHDAKRKGYTLASYVSSRAFVWRTATLGDNCFVFEANVVQHNACIGANVILWSGNHVGHGAVIGDHTFVTSHVVIAGFAKIGQSCLLNINASIADYVTVADDCVVGAGAVVLKDTSPRTVYRGNPATAASVSSFAMFGIRT